MKDFNYKLIYHDRASNARCGIIHTPHGDIETPAFVPVGTQASVKSLTPDELTNLEVRLFFVNTYHTYLRPGLDVIRKAGGIHRFMGWDGPIITDSGGFQVFSLGRKKYKCTSLIQKSSIDSRNQTVKEDQNETPTLVKISEDGVTFRSHWDGSEHVFTPESSMQYQWALGSDIHIAFDDCTPYTVTYKKAKESMERTHRWAERSLEEHIRQMQYCHPALDAGSSFKKDKDACFLGNDKEERGNDKNHQYQALYGSIQGSVFQDLRKESAKFITCLPFDGYAVGGVSVGESKEEMRNVMDWVCPFLPPDKPRHLLGVGEIDDIFALVEHGFDTFDCVQPTRLARMGRLYTRNYPIIPISNSPMIKYEVDILKRNFEGDMKPVDKGCTCYTCTHFSRAYLHHLFKVRELLGYRLATIHNIHFINTLVADIRLAIRTDSLVALKKTWNIIF